MALAMTAMFFTTPLAIFVVYLNATATEIGPWRSWADTHFLYSRVEQVPSIIWRSDHLTVVSFELTRWAAPFCALIFFAYFGFAQEARRNYRTAYEALARRVGLGRFLPQPSVGKSFASSSRPTLPKPKESPQSQASHAIPLRPARLSLASTAAPSESQASFYPEDKVDAEAYGAHVVDMG
ncbi:pheromone A receptor-domain-containing protein, partial [Mycena epipterygia]